MSDEELIARLHLPWPKDESGDEVTLPLWVLELTTEAADRIEELEAHLASMTGLWAKSDSEKQLLLARIEGLTKDRDEWQSLAEATIKDDAAKNVYYAEMSAKLATASHNAEVFGHKIVEQEDKLERISDAWAEALYSDLENGVSSINARVELEFMQRYPAISSFGSTLLNIMLEENT